MTVIETRRPEDACVFNSCRYGGECRECGYRYEQGEDIWWAPGYAAHYPECPVRPGDPEGNLPDEDESLFLTEPAERAHQREKAFREIEAAMADRTIDALETVPTAAALITVAVTPPTTVKDGTYTVVLTDNEHRTIRIRTQPADAEFAPGRRIVAFLSGSNNETDFTGFGFLEGREVRPWRRFSGTEHKSMVAAAIAALVDPESAGEAYALESGRCCRCNRKLTVPASLNRGMGPECAKK